MFTTCPFEAQTVDVNQHVIQRTVRTRGQDGGDHDRPHNLLPLQKFAQDFEDHHGPNAPADLKTKKKKTKSRDKRQRQKDKRQKTIKRQKTKDKKTKRQVKEQKNKKTSQRKTTRDKDKKENTTTKVKDKDKD